MSVDMYKQSTVIARPRKRRPAFADATAAAACASGMLGDGAPAPCCSAPSRGLEWRSADKSDSRAISTGTALPGGLPPPRSLRSSVASCGCRCRRGEGAEGDCGIKSHGLRSRLALVISAPTSTASIVRVSAARIAHRAHLHTQLVANETTTTFFERGLINGGVGLEL